MSFRFRDRAQAGQFLAEKLEGRVNGSNAIVLALPRGGLPVAVEVASRLGAPLDVFMVRKLGAPGHEELAIGAVASGGEPFLNQDLIAALHLSPSQVEKIIARENSELRRREHLFGSGRVRRNVCGRQVILVDDGLATGASMRAAIDAVRRLQPARIVVAVPVASPDVCQEFEAWADEVVCVQTPPDFRAVGQWYEDFTQISDEEVRAALDAQAHHSDPLPAHAGASQL